MKRNILSLLLLSLSIIGMDEKPGDDKPGKPCIQKVQSGECQKDGIQKDEDQKVTCQSKKHILRDLINEYDRQFLSKELIKAIDVID